MTKIKKLKSVRMIKTPAGPIVIENRKDSDYPGVNIQICGADCGLAVEYVKSDNLFHVRYNATDDTVGIVIIDPATGLGTYEGIQDPS